MGYRKNVMMMLLLGCVVVLMGLLTACASQQKVTDKLVKVCEEVSASPQIDPAIVTAKKACADVVPILKGLETPVTK